MLNLQSNADKDTNFFLCIEHQAFFVVLSTQKPMELNYTFVWFLPTDHAQMD